MQELSVIAQRDGNAEADIQAWAERRGLLDQWIPDQVRHSIALWRAMPEARGKWLAQKAVGAWIPQSPAPPTWDPTWETEKTYRARIETDIESVKQISGISPAPEKRTGNQHFEWLALHHVGGWKYERINERYADESGKPDIPAIRRAITETAALIGLTLRPGRGRGKLR